MTNPLKMRFMKFLVADLQACATRRVKPAPPRVV
jgi:hypothetical protein